MSDIIDRLIKSSSVTDEFINEFKRLETLLSNANTEIERLRRDLAEALDDLAGVMTCAKSLGVECTCWACLKERVAELKAFWEWSRETDKQLFRCYQTDAKINLAKSTLKPEPEEGD